tara:strand:+ start:351 stop:536 length:186 start_codon:yes stop_codon:yes gene_type:complete
MKNPIKMASIFATPNSVDELREYIEKLHGPEKSLAYTIMGMTGNLCSTIVDTAIERESSKK